MSVDQVIEQFEESCDKHGKLFVPDSPRQDKIAKSLYKFYTQHHSIDILNEAIDLYVQDVNEVVLVYEFAIKAAEYRDKVLHERESRMNFDKTMRETKDRMKNWRDSKG